MAEIHIQKKRSPVWPWIVGVLLVLIVALLLIENTVNRGTDEEGGIVYTDTVNQDYTFRDTSYASVMVNEFVDFIDNGDTLRNGGITDNEEFIKEGVRKLSGALAAVVNEKFPQDAEISRKTDIIQQKSDSLAAMDDISRNSKEIKEVFSSTVEVIHTIQQQSDEKIEISEVQESAGKIKENRPVTDQQEEIKTFFKETGDVLQTLARSDDVDLNNTRKF